MIEADVYFYGLTSVQERIVTNCIHERLHCWRLRKEEVLSDATIEKLVSKSWISFIDPRKLSCEELARIATAHRYATHHSHASRLVFTERLSKEQKSYEVIGWLPYSDLRKDWSYCKHPDDILEALEPYWNDVERMRGTLFSGEWYLLTMKTSGNDLMTDEVLSISVMPMVGYRAGEVKTLYIRQDRPISKETEAYTHITNEMLEAGVSREEAVEYLKSLSAPIIIGDDRREVPFLQLLCRLCGHRFDLPVLGLSSLTALVLCYLGMGDYRWRTNMLSDFFRARLSCIMPRRYERTMTSPWDIACLLEFVLSVFEQLEARYGIYGIDDLVSFYNEIFPQDIW